MTETRCPHCGSIYELEAQTEAFADDFGWREWWEKYPRKVGKLAAQRLYVHTVKRRLATPAQLMDGLKRYCTYKPDEQPWCHPKTWLQDGRWDDVEPEQAWDDRRAGRQAGNVSALASGPRKA